jgi:Zn-dependent M28 family amino/carboxypeptidase
VTAEEKGLARRKTLCGEPAVPADKNGCEHQHGRHQPVGPDEGHRRGGVGQLNLDDALAEAARTQGRTLQPDAEPEKGFYYRSDHFEFAKLGVPALYTNAGTNYVGKPADYGQQKRDEYTSKNYHKVTDDIKPDWDLSGAVEDLQLLFQVGWQVAQSERIPEWKAGTEFKARREEMLKGKN